MYRKALVLSFVLVLTSACVLIGQTDANRKITRRIITGKEIRTGAERTDQYLNKIRGKNVAVVANHTAMIGKRHLVDSLVSLGIHITRIFSPEHGFRGQAEAGENLKNSVDARTGIPVVSLYGKKKKPSASDLHHVDVILFDIQDVGTRFYTYATTMQYMMEACARHDIPFILLDRPNPNGYYIDGPVLQPSCRSFVGLNPIPLVHGMTLGEYASMINGEGWLSGAQACRLTVIPVFNYNHLDLYQLPVPPSPNLPNMASIYLYPSLGLFEGTAVSIGRGTPKPFQFIGYPGLVDGTVSFTPKRMEGYSTNPPYLDQICQGYDLEEFSTNFLRDAGKLYLFWILELYKTYPDKTRFFNSYFDQLAGNYELKKQIEEGMTENKIRESWDDDLRKFKKTRKKYLLYPDFE